MAKLRERDGGYRESGQREGARHERGEKKEEHGGVKWRVKMGERQRGRPWTNTEPKAISTLCSHEYFDDAQIHTYSYTHCKKILSPHLERSVKKTFSVCFKSFWFNQTAHLKRQDYLDLNPKGTSIADGNRGKNRHHKHNCFISAEASG